MPNLTYAALHLVNFDDLRNKKNFIEEHPLETKCRTRFNKAFMVEDWMFDEAFNVVWDSNNVY